MICRESKLINLKCLLIMNNKRIKACFSFKQQQQNVVTYSISKYQPRSLSLMNMILPWRINLT